MQRYHIRPFQDEGGNTLYSIMERCGPELAECCIVSSFNKSQMEATCSELNTSTSKETGPKWHSEIEDARSDLPPAVMKVVKRAKVTCDMNFTEYVTTDDAVRWMICVRDGKVVVAVVAAVFDEEKGGD